MGRVGGDEVNFVEKDVADDLGQWEFLTVDGDEFFEELQGLVRLRIENGDDDVFEDGVELLDLLCLLELAESQHDLKRLLMMGLVQAWLVAC